MCRIDGVRDGYGYSGSETVEENRTAGRVGCISRIAIDCANSFEIGTFSKVRCWMESKNESSVSSDTLLGASSPKERCT